jgi:2-oxoisovalerate dehydrogenase E1 component
MSPIAAGLALGSQLQHKDSIVILFIGDGTLGEGTLYESLNLISRWSLPVLVVLENNGYAQSTDTRTTMAGSGAARAAAFGIEYREANTWDYQTLLERARSCVDQVRASRRPIFLEVFTARLKSHSKGDDNRAPSVVVQLVARDHLTALLENQPPEIQRAVQRVDRQIEEAVCTAEQQPFTQVERRQPWTNQPVAWSERSFPSARAAELIYQAFRGQLECDPSLMLLGEDVEGPYGGAFKVTRDLSQIFPGRVRNTPISEAAVVGMGCGLALRGYKAVVEIMFGDFLTLTLDQLLQHACKFRAMFNDRVRVPLVVRTPMGGRRGYGPTHSQSIEKHFLGIPGLEILAVNNRFSPRELYETLLPGLENPALVIENKSEYSQLLRTDPLAGFAVEFSNERYPTVRMSPVDRTPQATIVCYGGMLGEAEKALGDAFDDWEIAAEVICPIRLYPFNVAPVVQSLQTTGRLLTVEEGPCFAGFGSEVVSTALAHGAPIQRYRKLGHDDIIPCCLSAERQLLPDAESIVAALKELVHG